MILCSCCIYILYSVCNCILMQGSSTRLAFATMNPTRYPFYCYHFLVFLVVLCLDSCVYLTFMPCKTELSLIHHLVLSCLVEAEVKEEVKRLFDQRYLKSSY